MTSRSPVTAAMTLAVCATALSSAQASPIQRFHKIVGERTQASVKNLRIEKKDATSMKARISRQDVRVSDVIDELAKIPEIETLYRGSAGLYPETYDVGVHTKRVGAEFEAQSRYADLESIGQEHDLDLVSLFKIVIALHDIGKSHTVSAGARLDITGKNATRHQHEATIPILVAVMKKLGYSAREIALSEALVERDLMGEIGKGELDLEEAVEELQAAAKKASMDAWSFYRLQKFFFVIDASSYENLRSNPKIFKVKGDRAIPVSKNFAAVEKRLSETHEP
jgi:hypothetical protein